MTSWSSVGPKNAKKKIVVKDFHNNGSLCSLARARQPDVKHGGRFGEFNVDFGLAY
jgi:hypothetical protein